MKELALTRGLAALVDDEDFEALSEWKWCAQRCGPMFYAARRERGTPEHAMVLLHRAILNAPPGMHVDHINRDTLDNRRENLRLATRRQNMANARHRRTRSGAYRGVWQTSSGRYTARVKRDGKSIYLGCYDTPEEAARAFDVAAREAYGEFATLNFPD